MPKKITPEEHIDRFISTAPRDALVRLQSEVNAALKYRDFGVQVIHVEAELLKRTRRKADAQLPLATKEGGQ